MQNFDNVLKLLLQQSQRVLNQLTGWTVVSWLPTDAGWSNGLSKTAEKRESEQRAFYVVAYNAA